jgi:hypothetical protein
VRPLAVQRHIKIGKIAFGGKTQCKAEYEIHGVNKKRYIKRGISITDK